MIKKSIFLLLVLFLLIGFSFSVYAKHVDQEILDKVNAHNSKGLTKTMGAQPLHSESEEQISVIVEMKEGTEKESAKTEANFNTKYDYNSFNGFAGNVSLDGVQKLIDDDNVKSIYFNKEFHIALNDAKGIQNATRVWPLLFNNLNLTGIGQTACILDTGINYSHANLGGTGCNSTLFAQGNCSRILGGYDYVNTDGDPYDDNGHGTHVAGIIASNGSTYTGMAPQANIIMIKVCNSGGTCDGNAMLAGLDWCISNRTVFNISVISMSIGSDTTYTSYCDNTSSFTSSINNVTRFNISVVIAAGNGASSTGISDPACIQNATAVSATTKADVIDTSYSNRASGLTDLLAIGTSITSTLESGGFGALSGTSMATPMVAGAILLLQQYKKAESNRYLTPSEAVLALNNTGKRITDSTTGANYSRIMIYNALVSIDSVAPNISITYPVNGNNYTYNSVTALNFSVSDTNLQSCWWTNNSGVSNYSISNCANLTGLSAVSSNTWIVYANDSAGNIGSATTIFTGSNITSCTTIASPGNYLLANSINSSGTCINITSPNVVLDCQGYKINYSESAVGYGVYTGFPNTTIKNCIINQTNGTNTYSYGIYLYQSSNSTITNNTITTLSNFSYGGFLSTNSNSNILSNNTITTLGNSSYGVYLLSNSNSNTLSNNTINTSGINSNGIILSSSSNTLLNNILSTSGSSAAGISAGSAGSNSIISNNVITTSGSAAKGISISSSTNSTISSNTITTSGSVSTGIHLLVNANSNTLSNNTITTFGSNTNAIFISVSSNSNTINGLTANSTFAAIDSSASIGNVISGNILSLNSGIYVFYFDVNSAANLTNTRSNHKMYFIGSNVTLTNITLFNYTSTGALVTNYSIHYDLVVINDSVTRDTTNNIFIQPNLSGVISENLPEFNRTANLTFLVNTGLGVQAPYRNGVSCDSYCANFNYNNNTGIATFDVSQFSNYTVSADISSPALSITTPANNTNSSNNKLNLNYTVNDINLQSCWYSNDTFTYNYTLLNCVNITTVTWSEGQHNVTIYANDSANNLNSTPIRFFVDSIPPNVSAINTPVSGGNYSGSLLLNASVNDTGLGINAVYFNLSNSTNSQFIPVNQLSIGSLYWGGSLDTTSMSDGLWNITLYANDTLNNQNNTVSVLNFRIDNTAPTVIVNSPAAGSYFNSNFTVNISVTDVGAGVNASAVYYRWENASTNSSWYRLVNSTASIFNSTFNLSDIAAEGNYTLRFNATDLLNNINTSVTISFIRDTIVPYVNATGNVSASVSSIGSTITFHTSESTNVSINYGTAPSLGTVNNFDSSFINIHSNSLTGLTAGTVYYYNITFCDRTNNCNITGTYNFTTTTIAAASSVSPSSGGGGGGGAAVTPTTASTNGVAQSWVSMDAGKSYEFAVAKSDYNVEKVLITPNKALGSVQLIVRKVETKPTDILREPINLNSYFQITKEGITTQDISNVQIYFSVDKNWVNGYGGKDKVKALRYVADKWEKLDTKFVSEANGKYTFVANTPGFSYFAIISENTPASNVNGVTGNIVANGVNNSDLKDNSNLTGGNESNKNKIIDAREISEGVNSFAVKYWWIFVIVTFIILLTILVYYYSDRLVK